MLVIVSIAITTVIVFIDGMIAVVVIAALECQVPNHLTSTPQILMLELTFLAP